VEVVSVVIVRMVSRLPVIIVFAPLL